MSPISQNDTLKRSDEWISAEAALQRTKEDLKEYIKNTESLRTMDIEHELKNFDEKMLWNEDYAESLAPEVEFEVQKNTQKKYL